MEETKVYTSENPIAIRSKKWINSALLELMKEKPFKSITIQEITNKAELDRRTFYRNFPSKEGVLSYYIIGISREYSDAPLVKEDALTIPVALRIFCEVAYTYKAFIQLLIENNLSVLLLDIFDERLPFIHARVENKFYKSITQHEAVNIECFFAYNAGGFWNILNKWFKDDNRLSPTQIADIVTKLVGNMFQ